MSPKAEPGRYCGAKTRTGGTCKNAPLKGATRCKFHGGKSPVSLKKAKQRLAEKAVMKELERAKIAGVTDQLTTDPLGELQKLTTELVHMKNQLTLRINDLSKKRAGDAETEIEIYLKVIDRLTKLLDIALKNDIEGKKIALEQSKADLVAALIIRVLVRAGITGDNLTQAKTYILEEIKQLKA